MKRIELQRRYFVLVFDEIQYYNDEEDWRHAMIKGGLAQTASIRLGSIPISDVVKCEKGAPSVLQHDGFFEIHVKR